MLREFLEEASGKIDMLEPPRSPEVRLDPF